MLPLKRTGVSLLGPSDADPVEVVNPDGSSVVLLVCEHAGREVPSALGDLGLAPTEMDRHIAYDIGAEGLSRRLSSRLDAPLVLQRYSRLVIDCNRPFEAADCIPETSDGTTIPANGNLCQADRMQRFREIHRPFHDAIGRLLDLRRSEGRSTILVTIHSFTARLANRDRPWSIGVCSNRDDSFARKFMNRFASANPTILAAHNEPYPVDDLSDYTIPAHGERRALPHVLLEIRNDQIADADGQERWTQYIDEALGGLAPAGAFEEHAVGA
jgi:predicted N-formylglutamate amidohydrolase